MYSKTFIKKQHYKKLIGKEKGYSYRLMNSRAAQHNCIHHFLSLILSCWTVCCSGIDSFRN